MRAGKPSVTARWIAANRALQAETRPSTPGGDPEAEARLYEGMGRWFVLPGLRPTGLAERTRFLDAEVARAIGQGVGQIVLIGAGYDGRALRFGGGAVQWWEVDFPATQVDKRARVAALGLAESPAVHYVGLDLMTGDLGAALAAAGHVAAEPTLFIAEGLLAYLTLAVCASVCEAVWARAAPGSVLAVNFRVAPEAGPVGRALRGSVGAALAGLHEERRTEFRPGDPEKLLVVTGWRVVRSDRSAPNRLDGGSHLLVVGAEPAP
jgi:methyltransferase (TIGR00027 family)